MRCPGVVAFLFINTAIFAIFLIEAFEPENDPYKLFDKYDADGSGSINHAELEKLLLAREIAQDLDAESLAQMYTILSQRYDDGDGLWTLEEFLPFADDLGGAGADGYEENRDSASYQYAAAIRHYQGRPLLDVDKTKAAELFKLSADKGHSMAIHSLAVMYYQGEGGLPQSDDMAIKLYREAVRKGNIHSMYNLGGLLLSNGKARASEGPSVQDIWAMLRGEITGDRRSEIKEALEVLQRAAKLGSEHAEVMLADYQRQLDQEDKLRGRGRSPSITSEL